MIKYTHIAVCFSGLSLTFSLSAQPSPLIKGMHTNSENILGDSSLLLWILSSKFNYYILAQLCLNGESFVDVVLQGRIKFSLASSYYFYDCCSAKDKRCETRQQKRYKGAS